jgi:hypothetical protein
MTLQKLYKATHFLLFKMAHSTLPAKVPEDFGYPSESTSAPNTTPSQVKGKPKKKKPAVSEPKKPQAPSKKKKSTAKKTATNKAKVVKKTRTLKWST